MHYVYVLISLKTRQYYIGRTKNIDQRLAEHNSGLSRYTKSRGPWKLIHVEERKTLNEAEKREKFLKTGDGRQALKRILQK
jgi:putative endonuclease